MLRYLYKGYPGELLPEELFSLYKESDREDWLLDKESGSYTYRKNLHVGFSRVGDRYELVYGLTPFAWVLEPFQEPRELIPYPFDFVDLRKEDEVDKECYRELPDELPLPPNDLKEQINTLLWSTLPGKTTLAEAEGIALSVYEMIMGEYEKY